MGVNSYTFMVFIRLPAVLESVAKLGEGEAHLLKAVGLIFVVKVVDASTILIRELPPTLFDVCNAVAHLGEFVFHVSEIPDSV